ncbi:MAG: glycosyltransferase family 2 protein [Saprospirales bacterium]|nr:glycosyltransferase family 2 protein [Saprospirales bacterium]
MNNQGYKNGVSVLMPAYNSAKYIAQSIESILNQTFKNFELIIINDGSSDNTYDIIASYSDKRIKYFQNEGNKGLIYTRNKLIELSNFEYIAFLDSDDLAENTRLETI